MKTIFRPTIVGVRQVSLAFTTGLLAAASLPAQEPAAFELGTVYVVANSEEKVDSLAQRVSALDIRQMEKTDLAGAVSLSPGVVTSAVGPRNESTVHVRGFDLRQTPVFIDGIPVYVPYDGYVDMGRFTTFDVAEINVSRGFSSVLYGANTLGGAINVVSRKPEKELEGELLAGWQDGNTWLGALNFGMLREHWYFQFGASLLDSEGFRISDDFKPRATEDGGRRDNADRQDWRISAKVGFTPNETDEYVFGYVYQSGEKGNPVYAGDDPLASVRYWRWPQWDKQTIFFVSHIQLGENSYLKPRLYFDQFQNTLKAFDDATYSSQFRGSSFTSYYDDYTVGGSVEFGTKLSAINTLKTSVHIKYDNHEEHNLGEPFYSFEDVTWSIGLEDTHEFNEQFSLVTGLSYDQREVLEAVDTNNGEALGGSTFDSLNPQIALFYEPVKDQRFHLSFARKSRYPTIKDRYSYRMGSAIPNPDLEPEYALHYELGYQAEFKNGFTVGVNVFYADINDTIQRVDNVRPGVYQFQNVGESRHTGAEVSVKYQPVDAFAIGVNYTWLDRENESQPDIKLLDTPSHYLHAWSEVRPVSWLSIIPSVEYADDRFSTTYGTMADSYFIANLKLSVRMPGEVTMSAGVNNLFDEDYALTEGYPMPGRTLFVNMQYNF